MELKKITLKPGRHVPVNAGHPWIFSGGIQTPAVKINSGEIVEVFSSDNTYAATGSWHGSNSIRIRVLSRDRSEKIDRTFFNKQFKKLYEEKKALLPEDTDSFRLVHSDADMLPGLIVDIYSDTAVFQINSAAMERFRDDIVSSLENLLKLSAIVERSDIDSRKMDNLKPLPPVCSYGNVSGPVIFKENGIQMISDVIEGQKTGFFLDQRDARLYLKTISSGRKVLDLFCYSGSFSVTAAVSGAVSVTGVDSSQRALSAAEEIFKLNSSRTGSCSTRFIKGDVFDFLTEKTADRKKSTEIKPDNYDIIICDPPGFAKSKDSLGEAEKAYVRLNRLCFEAAVPGSIIITSSCSGMIGWNDFYNIIKIAAGKAGKDAVILDTFSQAADHTRRISFPEGSYLKTAALKVTG